MEKNKNKTIQEMKEHEGGINDVIKALEDLGYKEVSNPLTGQNDCNDKVDRIFDYDKGYFRYFTKKQEKTLDQIFGEWLRKKGMKITFGDINTSDKITAIFKVLAVADYLNEGWKPDWANGEETKCHIIYRHTHKPAVSKSYLGRPNFAYFKDEETANKAIEILGEDVIKETYS